VNRIGRVFARLFAAERQSKSSSVHIQVADGSVELAIFQDPAAEDVRAIREAIYQYNRSKAGDQHYQALTILVHDRRGRLVGGLLGATFWRWLTVDVLWVADGLRGQGHGRRLLLAAEREARRRGCKHACLDTFSFQARGFYEKLGYAPFGVLDDFPGGHKRYFLTKTFRGVT
jgi:GNAT superfamily N-acetyltransferase